MSSIREVAQLAGVSPATVSRVINGTAQVSEEKRKRILDVIAETNFVPNEVARSLFKRSARTIGLIIPSIRNPYFTELAAELDELTLAYATTIHKAQGSEYPIVVMPFTMSHFVMLQRNLLYTGVTRAKKILVLIGERRAVYYAIHHVTTDARNTKLAQRLQEALPE